MTLHQLGKVSGMRRVHLANHTNSTSCDLFLTQDFLRVSVSGACTENQTRVIMTLKRESSSCPKTDYP